MSETAVGYSPLYGDTAGGSAVTRDVPKLHVYEPCRATQRTGAGRRIIPVDEPGPTAGEAKLRPDQRDDQMPAYEELDPIIEAYVEDDRIAES